MSIKLKALGLAECAILVSYVFYLNSGWLAGTCNPQSDCYVFAGANILGLLLVAYSFYIIYRSDTLKSYILHFMLVAIIATSLWGIIGYLQYTLY